MNLYDTLVTAIRDHWKAHDNQYPQRLVLSTDQHAALMSLRKLGRDGNASTRAPETDSFLGAPLVVDDNQSWVMVAVDGTVTPLPAPSA